MIPKSKFKQKFLKIRRALAFGHKFFLLKISLVIAIFIRAYSRKSGHECDFSQKGRKLVKKEKKILKFRKN